MENFTYYNPTSIIFGKGIISQTGEELQKHHMQHVLILYGSKRIEQDGTLALVQKSLKDHGINFCCVHGVKSNPMVSELETYLEIAKQNQVDGILAIGGGSVIDVAKALSIATLDDVSIQDILMGKARAKRALHVGVILTIAASGSESSYSMVLTIDDGLLKRSYNDELIRPVFAIMDPTLMASLPMRQLKAGAFDIMMHTLERYFSPSTHTELIDRMSEGLLIAVMKSMRDAHEHGYEYDTYANLMWAGSISHNGLLETGRITDWTSHRLEHELSGLFDVIHGEGLCAIWGSWAMIVYPYAIDRFYDFATNVMGIHPAKDKKEVARRGILTFVAFMKEMGMPVSLHELACTISEDDIKRMSRQCLLGVETIGHCKELSLHEVQAIYHNALGGVL